MTLDQCIAEVEPSLKALLETAYNKGRIAGIEETMTKVRATLGSGPPNGKAGSDE